MDTEYSFSMNSRQREELRNIEMKSNVLGILLGSNGRKNTKNRLRSDTFTSNSSASMNTYANYGSDGLFQQGGTSVNDRKIWDYLSNARGLRHNGEFSVNGKTYNRSEIRKMPSEMLECLKAQDNTLSIQSGKYYGVKTNDGGSETTWGMNADHGGFHISGSETMYAVGQGIALEELGDWSKFFRFMTNSGDSAGAGIYLGLEHEDVKSMMDTLGFEPGMCTIEIDGKENTFYYSHNGDIYPKYHYDGIYMGLTNSDNSEDYEVGDEFNYNGSIYTMDADGHVNVPYGEDLFQCISRPVSKMAKDHMAGEKIYENTIRKQ